MSECPLKSVSDDDFSLFENGNYGIGFEHAIDQCADCTARWLRDLGLMQLGGNEVSRRSLEPPSFSVAGVALVTGALLRVRRWQSAWV